MEGILPLWKEKGMTSHDCVYKLRKILKTKKVGHSGTLDPNVEGVLPVCIGKATKLIEYLMESGKIYEGEITLGFSTTTEDSDGDIIEQKEVPNLLKESEIDKVMEGFVGEIIQTPPMYSAVKVNGKRLYQYARAGEQVERPTRKAAIYEYKRTSSLRYNDLDKTLSWDFEVSCGKGTYVRTLAVDTGKKLGYPAHMSNLIRTSSGGFSSEQCLSLDQLKNMDFEQLNTVLYPLEWGVRDFPQVNLTDELWIKVKDGSVMEKSVVPDGTNFPCAFFYKNQVVSIYADHPSKSGKIKPLKMIRNSLNEE
ncbi:tRNA pseudouridine(55) synthase TruB [Lacticigenium naphthae]|uniref:tRNA pseudouridine(55) synthase TruB n=1 Tax=Lacticigenium naphthae TaxID=515351 RepID=UPI00041B9345|nr:tRNA pseudouridine(55) synthase TruB [Lacticigenium naphthae]